MRRVLVIVLGVWTIAQVTKGQALQRLGIITSGSTPAPATPAGPLPGDSAVPPKGTLGAGPSLKGIA